jgi:hypothetical protein
VMPCATWVETFTIAPLRLAPSDASCCGRRWIGVWPWRIGWRRYGLGSRMVLRSPRLARIFPPPLVVPPTALEEDGDGFPSNWFRLPMQARGA